MPSQTSVLDLLRRETQQLHAQLESRVDMEQALLSRTHYQQLLTRYLAIYRPLERALTEQPPEVCLVLEGRDQNRVSRLERDLRSLGMDEDTLQSLPVTSCLPDLRSLSHILGALYVVEGSAFGGYLLFHQVKKQLNLDEVSGASFFFGDSASSQGKSWKWLKHALESYVSCPRDTGNTAREMFLLFEEWLRRPFGSSMNEGAAGVTSTTR